MENKQIAYAYTLVKMLGYEKSLDEFKSDFETIYKSALNNLSGQDQLAKVEAIKNPFVDL